MEIVSFASWLYDCGIWQLSKTGTGTFCRTRNLLEMFFDHCLILLCICWNQEAGKSFFVYLGGSIAVSSSINKAPTC